MRVFLCCPPTGKFIRDERCQIDITSRVAENIREPIQPLYLAGLLKTYGHDVLLKDYSVRQVPAAAVAHEVKQFAPACVYLETTQGTIESDGAFIALLAKECPAVFFIIKTPFVDEKILTERLIPPLEGNDARLYCIVEEFERSIKHILDYESGNKNMPCNASGYIIEQGAVQPLPGYTGEPFSMDEYPVPPRYFLNKHDYVRPDTGEPIAYIYSAKGCPYDCVFCSAPAYLGTYVNQRSPEKLIAEMHDCIEQYGITNFFFRSDTFTFDKEHVKEFCRRIIEKKWRLSWGTNSRVDKIDEEMLILMKQAGCDIIGFGIESGSDVILEKIKKGISSADIEKTHRLVTRTGIRTFLHSIVGFPWDTEETVRETKQLIRRLNPHFIEVNVPYPLYGTELYAFAEEHGLFVSRSFADYSHVKPILKTLYMDTERINSLRRELLWSFYVRPSYIIKTLLRAGKPRVIYNYLRWGVSLIFKLLA